MAKEPPVVCQACLGIFGMVEKCQACQGTGVEFKSFGIDLEPPEEKTITKNEVEAVLPPTPIRERRDQDRLKLGTLFKIHATIGAISELLSMHGYAEPLGTHLDDETMKSMFHATLESVKTSPTALLRLGRLLTRLQEASATLERSSI